MTAFVLLAGSLYLAALAVVALADLREHAADRVDRMVAVVDEKPWLFRDPPAAEEPDPFGESRPIDLDDCRRCEGTGMVEARDWQVTGDMIWLTCWACHGTGERGAA